MSDEYISRLEDIGFEWEVQDSRWMQYYEELKCFIDRMHRLPKKGENSLSTWCNTQRRSRKKGLLSEERVCLLDHIGFVWEQDLDVQWMKNWKQVVLFYQQKGYWPKSNDGKLGAWCSTQRKYRKQGVLVSDRVRMMDEAGFIWNTDDIWLENYEKLKLFYQEKRRWPTVRENKLGSWCFVQRRLSKNGKLLSWRKQMLESISFPL